MIFIEIDNHLSQLEVENKLAMLKKACEKEDNNLFGEAYNMYANIYASRGNKCPNL